MRYFPKLAVLLLLICASFGQAAASSTPRKKSKKTVMTKPAVTRASYEMDAQSQVNTVQLNLNAMETRSESLDMGVRARFNHRLQMVQRKVREAQEKLADLQKCPRSKWRPLKKEFEVSWAEARQSFRTLQAEEPIPDPK